MRGGSVATPKKGGVLFTAGGRNLILTLLHSFKDSSGTVVWHPLSAHVQCLRGEGDIFEKRMRNRGSIATKAKKKG